MKRTALAIGLVLVILLLAFWWDARGAVRAWLRGEAYYAGRPSHVWAQMLVSPDPLTQKRVLEALAQGGDEAVGVLGDLLRDERPEVRWTAAEVASKLGAHARPLMQPLSHLVEDPDPHVRQIAVRALGQLVNSLPGETVPGLTRALAGP